MSKSTAMDENATLNVPVWLKNTIAAVFLIGLSIGGTAAIQTTAKGNGAPVAASPDDWRRTQDHASALETRIMALERVSDRQAANLENIANTLGTLLQETRENSAQVQRMAGALEGLNK